MEIQLTKREYLGEGYYHFFEGKDGKEVTVECTQEEYEALALPNPTNPTRKDCVWKFSAGGTIKVDTPSGFLGENEYCIKGDEAVVSVTGVKEDDKVQFLSKEEVTLDGKVEETKVIKT